MIAVACAALLVVPLAASAQWRAIPLAESRDVGQEPRPSDSIAELIAEVRDEVVEEIADGKVAPDEIWVTVIDARDPWYPRVGSWQGSELVYPASVVKMCFLVEAYDQLATGRIEMTDELFGDLRIMMSRSSNFATSRIVDLVSNTGFGESLEGEAADAFSWKRHTTTRKMQALGLDGIHATNKTYADGIRLYGRERDMLGGRAGDNFEGSNMMTTDDTARLLYMLHRRALVSPEASEEMLGHMLRNEDRPGTYMTRFETPGVTKYSKDGGTAICRHDAALYEFDDGGAIIIVGFTFVRTDGEYPPVVTELGKRIFERLAETPASLDNESADPDSTLELSPPRALEN